MDNLNDSDKIPHVVKGLTEFSGQPGEFNSVDKTLAIDEYRAPPENVEILSVIRNKITGKADIALKSYNATLNFVAV